MFAQVTHNWRRRPLSSYQVIASLIAATTKCGELRIEAALDDGAYPLCIRVSDDQMKEMDIRHDPFYGEWNYTLNPRR